MLAGLRHKLLNAGRMVRTYQNWPLALLDRLHLVPPRPVIYRLRNGVSFHVVAGTLDVQIINEVWVDRVYALRPDFAIRPGWTVVDLGSHKGSFAILAATSAPGVRVYAFEPAPQNFDLLRQNIELNALSNLQCFNVAIGGRDGKRVLHLYSKHFLHSFYTRPDAAPCEEVPVEVWSLGRALGVSQGRIDLLKVDIEGMEFEALFACLPADLDRVERIVLECHDEKIDCGHTVSDLIAFIEKHKFATQFFPGRHILAAWRIRNESE
jgi:FkbM family methyltransferase